MCQIESYLVVDMWYLYTNRIDLSTVHYDNIDSIRIFDHSNGEGRGTG